MEVCKAFERPCAHRVTSDTNTIADDGARYKCAEFTNDPLTVPTSVDVAQCLMGVIAKSQRRISFPVIPQHHTEGVMGKLCSTRQDRIQSPLRKDHYVTPTVTALMSDEDGSDVMSTNYSESSSGKVSMQDMFVPHLEVSDLPTQDEKAAAEDSTFSVCAALSGSSTVFDSAGTPLRCPERNQCMTKCLGTPQTSIFLVEGAEKSREASLSGSDNSPHKIDRESFSFTCPEKKSLQECSQMAYYVNSVVHSTDGNTCKLKDAFRVDISSSEGANIIQNAVDAKSTDCGMPCNDNGLEDERESIVSVCVSAPTTVNQSVCTIQAANIVTTEPIQRCTSEGKVRTRSWILTRKTALEQLRAELAQRQVQALQTPSFGPAKQGSSKERRSKEGENAWRQANVVPHCKGVEDEYKTTPKGDSREEDSTLSYSMEFTNERNKSLLRKDVTTGTVRASPDNFSNISHISVDRAIYNAPSMVIESLDYFPDDDATFHGGVEGRKPFLGDEPLDLLGTTPNFESCFLATDDDASKGVLCSPEEVYHLNVSPPRFTQVPGTRKTSSGGMWASRLKKLTRQQDQRNMAECTFHPTISPGSQSIMKAAAAAARRSTNKPISAFGEKRGLLLPVYDRLYPVYLSAEPASRRQGEEGSAYHQEIERELFLLRQRCGALYNPKPQLHQTPRPHSRRQGQFEAFSGFICNVLQSCLASSPPCDLLFADNNHAAFVESTYRSPMAIAIGEEEVSQSQCDGYPLRTKKKQNSVSSSFSLSMMDKCFSEEDTVCQPHHPCDSTVLRFAEFLDRQNMHHVRHERTVSMLAKERTPHFTPQTTLKSSRLIKEMINRSVCNSDGANTSEWIQRCRAQHIPVGNVLVSKHTSSHTDACSFSPKVSPAVRARSRQNRSSQGESSINQKATFQRLYESHDRLLQARKAARKRAEEEMSAKFSFKPALNTRKNAQMSSLLKPNAYKQYQEYLEKKRESQLRLKEEMETKKKDIELAPCTFKPQVNKEPAYLSKMVSSFRRVRQLELEF